MLRVSSLEPLRQNEQQSHPERQRHSLASLSEGLLAELSWIAGNWGVLGLRLLAFLALLRFLVSPPFLLRLPHRRPVKTLLIFQQLQRRGENAGKIDRVLHRA